MELYDSYNNNYSITENNILQNFSNLSDSTKLNKVITVLGGTCNKYETKLHHLDNETIYELFWHILYTLAVYKSKQKEYLKCFDKVNKNFNNFEEDYYNNKLDSITTYNYVVDAIIIYEETLRVLLEYNDMETIIYHWFMLFKDKKYTATNFYYYHTTNSINKYTLHENVRSFFSKGIKLINKDIKIRSIISINNFMFKLITRMFFERTNTKIGLLHYYISTQYNINKQVQEIPVNSKVELF